jgi:endonuclease/exonuclease/phosphatase (EEP) superfamily protein YafD
MGAPTMPTTVVVVAGSFTKEMSWIIIECSSRCMGEGMGEPAQSTGWRNLWPQRSTEAPQSPSAPVLGGMARRYGRFFTLAIVTGLLCGFAGNLHWVLELGSHFVAVYFLGALVALALNAVDRSWRWALLSVVCALVSGGMIVPWYLPDSSPPPSRAMVRILYANVQVANEDTGTIIDRAKEYDVDILCLLEVNGRLSDRLISRMNDYPHSKFVSREDSFGMAVLSRLAPEGGWEQVDLAAQIPAIRGVMPVDGGELELLLVHTLPPVSPTYAAIRNEQLDWVASETAEWPSGAGLVLGDLNCTMWSPYYRDLMRRSGLKNARRGRGVLATWPTGPLALLPIDHALTGGKAVVTRLERGPHIGSDHYPLLVEVRLEK